MYRSLVTLVTLLALAGCSSPAPAGQALPSAGATSASASAPEPSETEDPEPAEPTKDDFELTLKITKKQCFGSAGCNVSIKVDVSYIGVGDVDDLPSNVDITFEVKGGEDPYTSTIELEDGRYSPDEATIQTKSSRSKLTATITDVDSY